MNESKTVATNRKALHDYAVLEEHEAGVALTGTEIKSLRDGKANMRDAFARIEGGEVYVYNLHISPYEAGNRYNVDPLRRRKLLLHRQEIRRLQSKVQEKGLALIPVRIFINTRGFAKIVLALARGKREYDKREAIAGKDAEREMARAVKERRYD